jgi:hypothetical protein
VRVLASACTSQLAIGATSAASNSLSECVGERVGLELLVYQALSY